MCLVTYSVQLFSLLIQQYLFCWNPIDSNQHMLTFTYYRGHYVNLYSLPPRRYIEGLPMSTATMQQIKPNGKLYNLI